MIDGIGFGTYVFYACFCGFAALWAYFLVPEVMLHIITRITIAKLTVPYRLWARPSSRWMKHLEI